MVEVARPLSIGGSDAANLEPQDHASSQQGPVLRTGVWVLLADGADAGSHQLSSDLERSGHRVTVVRGGEDVLVALERGTFDMVLLRGNLPGMTSIETCRQVRARSDIAVILAECGNSVVERVSGFDAGADDYLPNPIDPDELDRRLRAVVRRTGGAGAVVAAEHRLLGPDGVVVDTRAHLVSVDGQEVALTPKEFSLLRVLLERRGEVLSSDSLSWEIWGYETFGSRNFVEAHISRLRAKLAAAGASKVVSTIRGVGYVVRN